MPYHVLIAEDEESLAHGLELNLRLEGYTVTLCRTGLQAEEVFKTGPGSFDLALLDVMLPGKSGFDLCRIIKSINPSLPVMFLTAKGQITDKREGLRLGADDYLTKPFDLEELLLRVANLVKRSTRSQDKLYRFESGQINFDTYVITTRDHRQLPLSRREIGLLELLTSSPGKVISRDQILEKLWEPHENASSRTIDNYILSFRKYFEENPRQPRHFHSVRGVGYKFTP